MDRKRCKDAARVQVASSPVNTKKLTAICLIATVAVLFLDWGIGALVENSGASSTHLSDTLSAGQRSYLIVMVVSLLCQMVLVLLWMGYAAFARKLSLGEKFSMDVLLTGFRLWSRGLMLYLLTAMYTGLWAGIFSFPATYFITALYVAGELSETGVLVGMSVCAMVLMLLVSYRYRMAWFVFLDEPELPTRQIVNQAKAINRVHRGRLFLLDLSFLPWMLLSALTCGIVLVWKLPYFAATYANAYGEMYEDYGRRQQRLKEMLERRQKPL